MRHVFMSAVTALALAVTPLMANAQEKVTYLFPGPEFLPAFAPFQLAKAKGYFADAGLEVTFRAGKGGADVAAQVAVGNGDLGGAIGDTPIIVRSNGLKVRGVALLGGRGLSQMIWRKDSAIKSLKDLAGKPIGVMSFQDTTYYNLLGVLAANGLGKDDVNIQAVGPGGLVQLMVAGKLDAISGVPEWAVAIKEAGVELVEMPVDTMFPAMAQAIIASDETIEKRPEMVQKFVGAVLHSMNDIIADPAQAAKDYVKAVPQHAGKEAQIETILRAYVRDVYPEGANQPLGTFSADRIAKVQDFYVGSKIIKAASPVEDLFTNEFVK